MELPARQTRWYIALSCFKYASILAYNTALHRSGRRPDPIYEQLAVTIRGLILDGELILAEGVDAVPSAEDGVG